MNKILTFFLAPVTAFFYPPVYREAVKSSPGRGVLFALYLAGLTTALVMVLLLATVMPQVDAFVDWAEKSMPVLLWTPAGLSLEGGKTTEALIHPEYGPIVFFDMTQTVPPKEKMDQVYLFVTAQKIFIKNAQGQFEERDITGAGMSPGKQLPPKIRIDGNVVKKLYQNLKGAMAFLAPLVMFGALFLFFGVMNLFYSLVGLLFNLMRTEKLHYGAIFNLACFATSGIFTLTWLSALLPPLEVAAFPSALNILINLALMFFAFKVTDKKKETV